jgi:apolipoprotein N-acyltransferase
MLLYLLRTPLTWLSAGILFFLSSLFWVRISMVDYGGVYPPIAYLLVLTLGLFLGLYQMGLSYLLWRLLRFNAVALPFIWTGVELLRSHFPYGGFPWNLAGEMVLYIPFLREYLSAGGVYLGSVLVISASVIPFNIKKPKVLIPLLLLFVIPIPFFKEPRIPDTLRGVKIAIFQTNVPENIKLDKPAFYRTIPAYWTTMDEILKEKPHIIFLPESAFPFDGKDIHTEGKKLIEYSKKAMIITGLTDLRLGAGGYSAYNSVFVIHKGEINDFYDKVKLLPFGEFVPFPFGFVKKYFGAIGGIDFTPGEEVRCLRAGRIRVGTPICFEVSYYSLVRKMSQCGELIAVLTNDAWFRDSDGTFQHMRQARIRAVENRKFVLWVNNTGPSAVISPDGEILELIPYGKRGYIVFTFPQE